MSILNTSVSGMQGDSNWLSTISQNVANSNTTGYKNVETDFSTLVDQIASGSQDFGGVSTVEDADSESPEELLEEGQTFEAEIVSGVEDAPDPDRGEVRTREVPEDDVPEEYDDQDRT